MSKKGKIAVKSGILGVKSAYLDPKNDGLATQIERLNGAKCRLYS